MEAPAGFDTSYYGGGGEGEVTVQFVEVCVVRTRR